jgi:hypothetical protein
MYESGYVGYDGEQPDFGSPEVSVEPEVAPRAAAPKVSSTVHRPPSKAPKKKKKKKKPSAKAATATSCTLSTDVTLVYAIS